MPKLLSVNDSTIVQFSDVVREVTEHDRTPIENGLERYVGLEHLDPHSLKIKRWGLLSEGTTFTKRFRVGQVLFGRRRAYQRKAAVPDFDGICSGDILVFEAKEEYLLPELLPFLVHTDAFFDYALGTSSGSLSPRTKWTHLAAFKFYLPPIERQKELVELFQAFEDAIAATEQSIAAAEQLKRSLLSELFTKGIGHTQFKQTEFGVVPEVWELATLGDVLLEARYGTSIACNSHSGTYPVLRIPNVVNERLSLGDLKFADASKEEVHRNSLCSGDILLVRTNGNPNYVGRGTIVPELDGTWLFASYLIRLRLNTNRVIPNYIHIIIHSNRFRNLLRLKVQTSAGNYNLNIQNLSLLPIALPSLHEQQAIIDLIESSSREIENLQIHKNKIESLKIQIINSLLFGQHDLTLTEPLRELTRV